MSGPFNLLDGDPDTFDPGLIATASEDGAMKLSHWDASDGRTLT
jgi:hypothetical protein